MNEHSQEFSKIPVICIDGPTASGKGTLATQMARRLGYHYLDSGALYRILGVAVKRQGWSIDASNEASIVSLARELLIQFDGGKVLVDGRDLSDLIRSEQAGMDASLVAVLPEVRIALLDLQRSFRRHPGLVADGRDMGTVVFPDSKLKIFLTASASQRAERRYFQLMSMGISASLDALKDDLNARDLRDSCRTIAPLLSAPDAFFLDNSNLSVEDCIDHVLARLRDS